MSAVPEIGKEIAHVVTNGTTGKLIEHVAEVRPRVEQTLAMANVPWCFCKESGCYRVRPGFRFPGLDGNKEPGETSNPAELRRAAEVLANDLSVFLESLRRFCSQLERSSAGDGTT